MNREPESLWYNTLGIICSIPSHLFFALLLSIVYTVDVFRACYDIIFGRHYCAGKYHNWRKKYCKLCHYPTNPKGKYPENYMQKTSKI